jgi:hypothetical protein
LSKHISALEDMDYVSVRKGYVGKTPRTWLALTNDDRSAPIAHMAALQEIAGSAARHA